MTDIELLEMAAKAAGYQIEWVRNSGCHYRCEAEESREQWCPLDDDGDALRLAVALCMNIEVTESDVYACTHGNFSEPSKPDRNAATRRAIVRAAAAIGDGLAPFPTADQIREDWT